MANSKIYKGLKWIWRECSEYVFPPQCLSCSAWTRTSYRLCSACDQALHPLPMQERVYQLSQASAKLKCYSLFPLTHPVRQLFVGLKYRHHPSEALKLLRHYLDLSDLKALVGESPIFVPVPLHPQRLRERGYNQAELLARALQQVCGGHLDLSPRRIRSNEKQAGLARAKRHSNAEGIFAWNLDSLPAKGTIVLVDDVITTGATLLSLSKLLQQQGPSRECVGLSLVRSQLTQSHNQDFALEQQIWGLRSELR